MVENFKGEHRVHTDIRLRQHSRAHIDATKEREREDREHTHSVQTAEGTQLPILSTITSSFMFCVCE